MYKNANESLVCRAPQRANSPRLFERLRSIGRLQLYSRRLQGGIDAADPIIKQAYEVTNGTRSEPAFRDI
jgi:hypothetical protein